MPSYQMREREEDNDIGPAMPPRGRWFDEQSIVDHRRWIQLGMQIAGLGDLAQMPRQYGQRPISGQIADLIAEMSQYGRVPHITHNPAVDIANVRQLLFDDQLAHAQAVQPVLVEDRELDDQMADALAHPWEYGTSSAALVEQSVDDGDDTPAELQAGDAAIASAIAHSRGTGDAVHRESRSCCIWPCSRCSSRCA